jgi:tripartite-type tricarboxylate transporter receptor subunit TctC
MRRELLLAAGSLASVTCGAQRDRNFDTSNWFAFFAPAKTPKRIIDTLNAELVRVLTLPEVNQFLVNTGIEVSPGTPEALASFVKAETEKYRKIIQVSGTELQ